MEKDQPGQKGMVKWRKLFTQIRNLSEAGSQCVRNRPLGDKGLVFALSPEPTPPMGQLISGV